MEGLVKDMVYLLGLSTLNTLYQRTKESISHTRMMITFMTKNGFFKHELIGIEIGVRRGENSKNILQNLPIKKLYLIDPYLPYQDGKTWRDKKFQEEAYRQAKKNVKPYKQKIEFIKKSSEQAIKKIPNNIDFVYIDGNHKYEYIKKDIELYYPKIKKHGILGRHDFTVNNIGVIQAASEFANKNNIILYLEHPDWWIIKEG